MAEHILKLLSFNQQHLSLHVSIASCRSVQPYLPPSPADLTLKAAAALQTLNLIPHHVGVFRGSFAFATTLPARSLTATHGAVCSHFAFLCFSCSLTSTSSRSEVCEGEAARGGGAAGRGRARPLHELPAKQNKTPQLQCGESSEEYDQVNKGINISGWSF